MRPITIILAAALSFLTYAAAYAQSEIRFTHSGESAVIEGTEFPLTAFRVRISRPSDDSVAFDASFPVPGPDDAGVRIINQQFSAELEPGTYRVNMQALYGALRSEFSNTVDFEVRPADREPEAPVVKCFTLRGQTDGTTVLNQAPCL